MALRGHAAVYRMFPAGQVTVVAGTGSPGFSGDGGLATNAKLNIPTGVAVDAAGNLYIRIGSLGASAGYRRAG